MRIAILILCVLLISGPKAFPWGGNGHKAIAEAARGMLTPEAKAKIVAILGNDDLAAVAGWLDDVALAGREQAGPLKDDPEAKEFNEKFPKNDLWHRVDYPVGITRFFASGVFTTDDDLEHAINHAIDVLEGKASDMTPQQALKVLVPLVSDAHEPLHCAAGYYDLSNPTKPKLLSAPVISMPKEAFCATSDVQWLGFELEKMSRKPNDRGGNQLFIRKSLSLQTYWEKEVVKSVADAVPAQPLAQSATEEEKRYPFDIDDYHYFPMLWIEDTAPQAIEIYRDITFGPATLKPDGTVERIEITLPKDFRERQVKLARVQMGKAALHLASLLNSIRFK